MRQIYIMSKTTSNKVKIVFAGQSGVGKSSIVYRIEYDKVPNVYLTVGVSFISKKITRDDKHINLEIWDTAGQERYQSMAEFYFRNATYCILVFDINDIGSFLAVKKWMKLCNRATINSPPIYFLVGNKSDLHTREVSLELIQQYCYDNNIQHYYETSAYTGSGIKKLYVNLIDDIFRNSVDAPQSENIFPYTLFYEGDSIEHSKCTC